MDEKVIKSGFRLMAAVTLILFFGHTSDAQVPVKDSLALLLDTGRAQFQDTLHHVDTLKTVIVPPTVSEIVIQTLVGEAACAGVLFAFDGAKVFHANDTIALYSLATLAVGNAMIASAVAITVWGNAFSLGENNCWRPLAGSLAGLLLLRVFNDLDKFKLYYSSVFAGYSLFSTSVLAGEMLMYYLWPSDPVPSVNRSSSGLRIAPFISPQVSGIGFSYPIQ